MTHTFWTTTQDDAFAERVETWLAINQMFGQVDYDWSSDDINIFVETSDPMMAKLFEMKFYDNETWGYTSS